MKTAHTLSVLLGVLLTTVVYASYSATCSKMQTRETPVPHTAEVYDGIVFSTWCVLVY